MSPTIVALRASAQPSPPVVSGGAEFKRLPNVLATRHRVEKGSGASAYDTAAVLPNLMYGMRSQEQATNVARVLATLSSGEAYGVIRSKTGDWYTASLVATKYGMVSLNPGWDFRVSTTARATNKKLVSLEGDRSSVSFATQGRKYLAPVAHPMMSTDAPKEWIKSPLVNISFGMPGSTHRRGINLVSGDTFVRTGYSMPDAAMAAKIACRLIGGGAPVAILQAADGAFWLNVLPDGPSARKAYRIDEGALDRHNIIGKTLNPAVKALVGWDDVMDFGLAGLASR